MGGRGSGGSKKGGGGGGGSAPDINKNLKGFVQTYKEKFEGMNDKDLEKAYKNTQIAMNKENARLEFERNKLQKMRTEYQKVKETDSDYKAKSDAFDKQIAKVSEAQSMADARTRIHYIALNEKNNVRAKHVANNIKQMSDGQLNSYYNRSYRESNKARDKAERTNNKKTQEKYTKLYQQHSENFNKANQERRNRGLDGKDW